MPKLLPESTLHARIYARLKVALMAGLYRPGQKVTIRSLAKSFGTSTMPVREALQRLASEGAIETLPNRTVRVPCLTRERLEEITRIRTRLEALAAGQAALKMKETEILQLEALQREMIAAKEQGDYQNYIEKNEQFHFHIYTCAGMPTLLRLIEVMWLQCGPTLNLLLPAMRGTDLHADAIAAIRLRNRDAAGAAIEWDIQRAATHLKMMLEEEASDDVTEELST